MSDSSPTESTRRPTQPPQHAALRAPQFRLSTLMIVVTCLSGLLAASLILHPLLTFGLVLFALAIVAHVAGNYYGTQLRDQATELIRTGEQPEQPQWEQVTIKPQETSRMNDRAPLGIALAFFIVVGAACGATAGSYWLGVAQGLPLAWPDFCMGCFAFGVLGAIGGFAVGGFVCIGYRVIRQVEEQSRQ